MNIRILIIICGFLCTSAVASFAMEKDRDSTRTSETVQLDDLPTEILLKIFSELELGDQYSWEFVSEKFHNIACSRSETDRALTQIHHVCTRQLTNKQIKVIAKKVAYSELGGLYVTGKLTALIVLFYSIPDSDIAKLNVAKVFRDVLNRAKNESTSWSYWSEHNRKAILEIKDYIKNHRVNG